MRPLEEYRGELAVIGEPVEESRENPNYRGEGDEDNADGTDLGNDDDEEGDSGTHQHDGSTFEEAMTANIDLILDMAVGPKYHLQFRDQQLLNALQREGAGFLRFAKAKEKRVLLSEAHVIVVLHKSKYRNQEKPHLLIC